MCWELDLLSVSKYTYHIIMNMYMYIYIHVRVYMYMYMYIVCAVIKQTFVLVAMYISVILFMCVFKKFSFELASVFQTITFVIPPSPSVSLSLSHSLSLSLSHSLSFCLSLSLSPFLSLSLSFTLSLSLSLPTHLSLQYDVAKSVGF